MLIGMLPIHFKIYIPQCPVFDPARSTHVHSFTLIGKLRWSIVRMISVLMLAPNVSVYLVEGVSVFGLLSEVLGICASVDSASFVFFSSVELATMVFSNYVNERIPSADSLGRITKELLTACPKQNTKPSKLVCTRFSGDMKNRGLLPAINREVMPKNDDMSQVNH